MQATQHRARFLVERAMHKGVIRLGLFESEQALVAAIRAGEPTGGAALYDLHHDYVRRVLMRVIGPDGHLEDLIQDVFVAAIEGIERLEDPQALRSWIAGIAVNVARAELRKRTRTAWLRFLPGSWLPELEAVVSSPELDEAVRAAYRVLGHLQVEERIAFALRFIEGMELSEVASSCQTSLATTKRRLHSARKKFENMASTYPELAPWLQGGAP
jgi:RNA polymerase sigma-70 factor (ECF subfamily)